MRRLVAPASALLALLVRTDGVSASATCDVPPVNLTSAASEDGSAVVLTWQASLDCTPDTYAVYRRDMDVEGARMVRIATVDGSTPTYTDDGVNAGERYRYRIRSNDLGARSGRTDVTLPEAAATAPAPEPPSPPGGRSVGPRDSIIPTLQVANLNGTSLVLIHSELLDSSSIPATGDFSLAGTTATVSSVTVRGAEVALTLSTAPAGSDTVTLAYTKGTNPIKDRAGNEAVSQTNWPVKNHTSATNRPAAFSAESITLTVDENSAMEANVGSEVAATDADSGDTLTYSFLSGYTDFSVDASGQIQVGSATLDFEGGTTTFETVLFVRDSKSPSGGSDSVFDDSIHVTITVTNVDEAGEVTLPGTIRGGEEVTATLTDPDENLSNVTWQWSRGETQSGTFDDISGATSNPYLPTAADVGKYLKATANYTDGHGSGKTATSDASGPVASGNVQPSFSSTMTTRTVPENSPPGTHVGAAVTATGGDDDELEYSLSGADASSFLIIANNDGTITTKTGVTYDYESSKNSYTVVVSVSDQKDDAGLPDTAIDASITVTINLTNADDPGTVTLPTEFTSWVAATATVSDPDGATSSRTWQWSIADTPGGMFTDISGATSATYTPTAADVGKYLKATARYTDPLGAGKTATSAASSQVVRGNVDPEFEDGSSTTREVAENSSSGAHVGAAVLATDGDDDPLFYSLSGTDASSFIMIANTGVITTKSGITYDYETKNTYSLVVNVHDGYDADVNPDTSNDDSINVTINLTNVDEAGTVTITGTELGGEELTASLTDLDGGVTSVTWRWARGDSPSGSFTNIGGATSASYALVSADVNKYVRATASYTDGQGSGKSANAVTGEIAPGNAEPTFDDGSATTRAIAENSTEGTDVGAAVSATDNDNDELTYSLTGTDASSFTIVSSSGQIRTKTGVTYNFEGKNSYSVTVNVRDSKDNAGNANTVTDDTIAVTISLTDVNETPAITTSQTAISVAENQTSILTYAATDVDNNGEADDASNTLTWSVENADDGSFFDIDPSSGVLTFKNAPNFEDRRDAGSDNVYNVTVTVTDNGIDGARGASNHLSVSKPLAVTVTDVNETPTLTTAPATASFDENGTGVVATYIATDPDMTTGTMSWDLLGNDAGDFNITSTVNGTAELTFKNPPDYEMPDDTGTDNVYDVTVRVRDNASPRLEDTQSVAVTVNDLNERPVVSGNATPSFREIAFDRVPTEIMAGDFEVATFTAYDDDGDTIEWTVSGDDAAHFSMDLVTGALSFNVATSTHPETGDMVAGPDFERPVDMDGNNEYVVQVRAVDQQGEANSVGVFDVTVTVTNLNEIPVVLEDTFTFNFAEIEFDHMPVTNADLHVFFYNGYDEEGDNIDFGALDPDASVLSVADYGVGDVGRLIFDDPGPNYEAPTDQDGMNDYEVTVRVRDTTTGKTRDYPVEVTVTNVDETPEFITPAANAGYDEIEYDAGVLLADIDDVVDFRARDEEGEDLTWSLAGLDASDFTISKNADGEGVLRFADLPDFERSQGSGETSNRYEVTIVVMDGTASPNTAANVRRHGLTVLVNDVNERPSFTGSPAATVSYDENATSSVASYTAHDEEGGVTWTLTGPDRADFTIDGGTVTFVSTPDFENPVDAPESGQTEGDNVYKYTVVARDIHSKMNRLTAEHEVMLTVQDVEEPGAITVDNLNPGVGDVVTFTISDPDGGIVSEIGGPGSEGFSWSIQTREPLGSWQEQRNENTALAARPLEYPYTVDEDDTGREIRAVVTSYTDRRGSGKMAESEATAAVTALPIANAPPRLRTGTTQNVPETAAGEEFGEPLTATDRDNDTVTWGIGTGADSALFEIHPSTGRLRTLNGLDFETTSGLLFVHVTLSDGHDADDNVESTPVVDVTGTISITVLDVEEEGVVTLSEPEPGVGTTIQATLADGDGSITGRSWRWARSTDGRTGWSNISGATSSSYQTVLADANFFLRAVVTYTDNRGGGKRAEAVTSLRVFGENQQPVFPSSEDGERSVAENSRAGTSIGAPVAADDPESDRLTYSLSGTDAASFTIVAGSAQLRVKEPLDFETKASYEVTVDVHDGRDGLGNASATIDDSIDVTITVTNEDEPGTVTLTTLTATIQARVEVTAVLEDGDGPSSVTWAWARSPNGRTDWVNLLGATSSTYTPTLVDAGNYIRATAAYNDGHGSNKTASKVSTRVGDPPPVNSAPAFPATEDGKREAPENLSGGDIIGDPVAANDVNFDALTYSLGGTDAASFEIDASSGQLRLASGVSLDFEGKKSYRVTVSVSDGADQNDDADDMIDDTITVVVTVTDVNEAPVLSGETSPSIAENSSAAIATYTAADPERDTLEWSVNSTDFWVSSRGQLYFATPPDFEDGNTSFSIRVTATDPDGLEGGLDVTVSVTDVEEAGVLTISPPRGWDGTRFDTRLTDDDGSVSGEAWQWARSSNRSSWQDIAGATSSSYTAGADDVGSYLRATVAYSDRRGSNKTASAVTGGRIGELRPSGNAAPTFDEAEVPRSVGQGPGAGRSVGAPVKATDPDADDILTYTLTGPDADNFEVDPETGQIRTKAVLDPDVQETHDVTVDVHDGFTSGYDPSDATDDSVDVIITVARVSRSTFGGGGFFGAVGGGGPAGPTPSDVEFEWNVTRDIEPLAATNSEPTGLWGNGAVLWVAQNGGGANDGVYAYDLATGERVEAFEFGIDELNRAPRGIWSDRETVWISDSGQERVFAYGLASGERLPDRDLQLASRNRDARGIWAGGGTLWVADGGKNSLFAYDLASGEFIAEYALADANGDPRGIWSDGHTVWVSDHNTKRLYAYVLPVPADDAGAEDLALERAPDEDFTEPGRVGNNSPRGIWSGGDVMYVADATDDRIYTYNMPDATDARLASLTLSGVEIGEFDPGQTDYTGVAGVGVTETIVEAETRREGATIVIDPADADERADGHQVALPGLEAIAVTVTSQDGSRERVYRVALGEAGPSASCLRGAVSLGFSLVAYEGGSVDDLVRCAESRNVTALYALHEGEYLAYIVGAPEFVSRPFLELYADGVPPLTVLTVSSAGPATPAPDAPAVTEPFATCLQGAIGEGFSLVLYEGGSIGDLAACASSLGITALYALVDGGYVPYIVGAPAFVSRPFFELYADGVPALTPLVVRSEEPPEVAAP